MPAFFLHPRGLRPSPLHHLTMARDAHRYKKHKSSRSAGQPKQANKNANAVGYAKRQALRSKRKARDDDVYEYAPEKKGERRAKIKMDFDPEEIMDVGGAEEREELRARLIGENSDEEGGVDSEDDEEIESDDAFDEEDDDRFAGFFTKKTKKVRGMHGVCRALRLMYAIGKETAQASRGRSE